MNRTAWLRFFFLVVVVTLVYANHFHNSFHFDDSHTIQSNSYIQHIGNIPLFFKDGSTISSLPSNQAYRPVLTTSIAIDYWLGGGLKDTFQFHLSSFLLFLSLGFLLLLLYQKVFSTVDDASPIAFIAFIGTAVYLLHPVSAETVNYIIQRGDIFATFFTVLGMVLYLYSPFAKRTFLYLLPVFIGILSKPNTLVFAPILGCYIYLFEAQKGGGDFIKGRGVIDLLKKVAPAFVICIIGYIVMSKMQSKSFVPGGTSPFLYIISQPFMLGYYFTALFAPVHLNADTDWQIFTSLLDARAIFGFVFLFFLVALIYITSNYKKSRPIAFGLLWFLIGNLPTSLLPFAEVMNDHRMFLPFVGLVLAVVWAIYICVDLIAKNLPSSNFIKYLSVSALVMVFVGLAYGTYQRNEVWKTEESLWKDCAEKSPNNGRALMNYGLALMARADYKNAEIYFQRGLDTWPYYAYQHVNMGILKNALGKTQEAEQFFLNGINYGTNYPNSYFYYARFLTEKNRKTEAVEQLKKALAMSKSLPDAQVMLMNNLYDLGRLEELSQIAKETLQINPDNEQAKQYLAIAQTGKSKLEVTKENATQSNKAEDFLDLSLQLYNAGKYEECIEAAKKAVALKPDFTAAYNNMGSAYNMLGRFEEGKVVLQKAIAIDANFQLAKNNLAWAEAEIKKKK